MLEQIFFYHLIVINNRSGSIREEAQLLTQTEFYQILNEEWTEERCERCNVTLYFVQEL